MLALLGTKVPKASLQRRGPWAPPPRFVTPSRFVNLFVNCFGDLIVSFVSSSSLGLCWWYVCFPPCFLLCEVFFLGRRRGLIIFFLSPFQFLISGAREIQAMGWFAFPFWFLHPARDHAHRPVRFHLHVHQGKRPEQFPAILVGCLCRLEFVFFFCFFSMFIWFFFFSLSLSLPLSLSSWCAAVCACEKTGF